MKSRKLELQIELEIEIQTLNSALSEKSYKKQDSLKLR